MSAPDIGHGIIPGATSSPLTRAVVNFSGSGDNTVVAAVANQTIRVFRVVLVVGGSTSVTIKDGASTGLTGPLPMQTGGGITLDYQKLAWYQTSAGNALVINSSAAVQVSGSVEYQQS